MSVVIKVEGISKSYIIRHQQEAEYTALRDVIADNFKKVVKSAGSVMNKKPESSTFKKKEEFWAVKDISFDVQKGERIGVIGRNGAGKSTLLKILSRITDPTQGRLSLKGRIASLLEVGTGFHPELTGRENIFLNGAILGMKREEIKRKFDEIVEFAEVSRFLDTPVKRYSSGMYVRLAFAVAANLESEILVVDEVLAVGDLQFQKKCLGKMQDVSQQDGRTVLFVSHNMGAINQLCDKAILLKNGQIDSMGSTGSIVRKYLKTGVNNGMIDHKTIIGPLVNTIKFSKVKINEITEGDISISPSSDLLITLSGTCSESLDYFRTGITILKDSIKLFSIHNSDEPQRMEPGPFVSEFRIKKYLLRPGDYTLSIYGHDDGNERQGKDWIYGNEILAFTILEEWDAINDSHNEGIFNLKAIDY